MNSDNSHKIAANLLQINAIKLQPANPFTWSSGWKSPIYCDNRKILSYPEIRNSVSESIGVAIQSVFGKPDLIAGVATGAIAHGVLAADKLKLPFIYVRQDLKAHGMKNIIEGELPKGKKVVVIEDLISTGKSSLSAVNAIRQAGGIVSGLVAIFTYGFPEAEKAFREAGCRFTSLCDYQALIKTALDAGYITRTELQILIKWRENPAEWKPY
ncbi:MAG: orotate phosphoribosyltransferase [Bacteroidetes bacterium]|nr:orotate phosphoribosyltransferase [Bacteroidota bacterium]